MPYYSRQDIRKKVSDLVESAGVNGQIPVPLEALVDHLGYELMEFEPDAEADAISGAVSHKKKRIYLNADDSARRKVFTLAHEIGHIVLHRDSADEFVDYRKTNKRSQKEWEADNFAGELLMPREHFKKKWYALGRIPWRAASEYGVSEQAAKVRAMVLGLSTRNPLSDFDPDEEE